MNLTYSHDVKIHLCYYFCHHDDAGSLVNSQTSPSVSMMDMIYFNRIQMTKNHPHELMNEIHSHHVTRIPVL